MAIIIIEVKEEIDTQDMQDLEMEEGFFAGEIAPAGTYEDLETHRLVYLPNAGVLPASCDGHVAFYAQKPPTWGEVVADRRATQEKGSPDVIAARPKLEFVEGPAPSTIKKNTSRSAKEKLLAA